jgi:HSP20 family protein
MNLQSIIPWKKEERSLARGRGDSDPFAQLHRRMNSVFEDFFGRSSSDLWGDAAGEFLPRVDVSETGKEVRITAELPGLDEKDVEVTVTNNMLTIKGEKKVEKEEEEGDYYNSERSYGYFDRTIALPQGIDADNAKAKFKKGVFESDDSQEAGSAELAEKDRADRRLTCLHAAGVAPPKWQPRWPAWQWNSYAYV